jgi:peptidoglycan hydrolase-like protein with peptidoglycan-binding domain
MRWGIFRAWAVAVAAMSVLAVAAGAAAPAAPEAVVTATPDIVREIQFLLHSLGMDPGPIDGVPRQMTNRAVRAFEEKHGLAAADLAVNAPVPPGFLAQLRREAAAAILSPQAPAAAVPAPAAPAPAPSAPAPPAEPPPSVAVAPPRPASSPPPPDRFAACAFTEADFRIGGQQFTPQGFLDDGFGGSNARAVASLKQRLDEARGLAEKIGGAALGEVQRQARVLGYFECRLKIEQAPKG